MRYLFLSVALLFAFQISFAQEVVTETPENPVVEVNPLLLKGVGPITELNLDEEIDQSLVRNGRRFYNLNCRNCHPVDGEPKAPIMMNMIKKRSPEWIMNMMLATNLMHEQDPLASVQKLNYKRPMPQKDITEEQAREVLEYIRTLQD